MTEAGLKVVVDTAGGAAALVLPTLLGRLGVDVLTVNNRLDEVSTTESLAEHLRDLERLGELVSSSRAAFGVRFDHVGERLAIVDERGELVHDDRALLVLLDLVAAERGHGSRIALPVTTTRVAEQVTSFHGAHIAWTSTSPEDLSRRVAEPDVVFGGDGRGRFVIPEFTHAVDGVAAFVRLLGLVARTQLTLSQIDARIPHAHVVRRSVPTPWAVKGTVMRRVLEAAGDREIDTTDGVRVVEPDGSWALVLPDPAEALTHLWAEASTAGAAAALPQRWAAVAGPPTAPRIEPRAVPARRPVMTLPVGQDEQHARHPRATPAGRPGVDESACRHGHGRAGPGVPGRRARDVPVGAPAAEAAAARGGAPPSGGCPWCSPRCSCWPAWSPGSPRPRSGRRPRRPVPPGQSLVAEVRSQTAATDALAAQEARLRREVAAVRGTVLGEDSQGQALAEELAELELLTGATAVHGPGLVVTLNDATAVGAERRTAPRATATAGSTTATCRRSSTRCGPPARSRSPSTTSG